MNPRAIFAAALALALVAVLFIMAARSATSPQSADPPPIASTTGEGPSPSVPSTEVTPEPAVTTSGPPEPATPKHGDIAQDRSYPGANSPTSARPTIPTAGQISDEQATDLLAEDLADLPQPSDEVTERAELSTRSWVTEDTSQAGIWTDARVLATQVVLEERPGQNKLRSIAIWSATTPGASGIELHRTELHLNTSGTRVLGLA